VSALAALAALVPLLPVSSLRRPRLRARLARAERVLDGPFDKQRSLEIDALVMRLEAPRRRTPPRTLRRAA
jgi:hypothetical protein